ncbi:MAG: hypothetical protein RIC87_08680 [Kiloniellales bacterium]
MRSKTVLALSLLLAGAGLASAEEPMSADCLPAVGSYITKNSLPDGQGGTIHSRSLISLTNGGHALRSDSDQYSGLGKQAFGDSHGAWRCAGVKGEEIAIRATMLNFSYPQKAGEDALIGVITYQGSYNTKDDRLRLSGGLRFVGENDDPFGPHIQIAPIPIEVEGVKIEAPR